MVTKTRRDKIKKPMVFETPVNFMVTKTITAPQKPFAFETPVNFIATKTPEPMIIHSNQFEPPVNFMVTKTQNRRDGRECVV